MDGWIKLHRKITESAIFADPDLLRLWIYCLSNAAYKSTTVLIDKQEVSLLPGQFITGRFSLYEEYNAGVAPRKKIKDTTLWNWMKRLESFGNLDIKSYNKYSVVTVVKWDEYQDTLTTEPQQIDNRLTTEPQQIDTNKKLKNLEKEKKLNNTTTTSDDEISVMTTYTKVFGGLVMTGLIQDYVRQMKANGSSDAMICELMLETGQSSAKPNLNLMRKIGERWIEQGIKSRAESKAQFEAQKPTKLVAFDRYRKPDKQSIPMAVGETGQAPSDDEFERMMKEAAEMAASKQKH